MTLLKIGRTTICLALVFSATALAAEEPKLTVTVDPNPVSEHESLQLKIQVESPLTTPVFQPSFDAPDFTVVGSGMYYSAQTGGGAAHKTTAFTFVLMPKRAGDFSIRAIEAKVGGSPVRGPEQKIKVVADATGTRSGQGGNSPTAGAEDEDDTSNPASPYYNGSAAGGGSVAKSGKPGSAPSRFNSDFTVWSSVGKLRAYVGEPIVVEYYLYDLGGIRQTEVLQWPTFTGFWKDDLELRTQVQFEDVYLSNQEMRRAFIARYALYGIKPGRYNIDKLGIRARYVTNDLFRGGGPVFGFDLRTGQHFSQDVSVEILPLPEKGRPANFSGAVGNFKLSLTADKQTVPQNTPVNFTITLSGTGNLQAIDSIKLPLPADFELYESAVNGKGSTPIGVRRSLEGQKTFQIIAIPRKAGKFELPAITWSYFNPEKETYEALTTNPLPIEVTENANSAGATNSYLDPKPAAQAASQPSEELRALKPVVLTPSQGIQKWLTWAAWALLLANLILLFRLGLGRSKGIFGLVKSVDPFAPARFALLRSKGHDVEWQAELEEVLLMAMQVLLDTNPRGLTKSDLQEAWKAKKLPAPLYQRVESLLEEIDRHRFSSQKLPGAGSRDLRSRLTREAEGIIAEATKAKRQS